MNRMNNKIKNFYGIGDMCFSLMTVLDNSFLMIFLTDIAQLPLAITATILSITSLADAATSLVAGGILDKTRFKWGKYRSWLLIGPVISTLFFALQFSKIGNASTTAIVFTVAYIIGHFLWNIFFTANRALAGSVTDDPSERAHISGRISSWMSAGRIIGSKLIVVLIGFLSANISEASAYTYTALIVSLLMSIGYYIHFKITEGYDRYDENVTKNPVSSKVSILDMLKGVAKNPPLITVLLCDSIRLSGFYVMLALVAYYSKIVLNNPASTGNILLIFNIGNLLGPLFTKVFVKKIGTKWTTAFGLIGTSICMLLALVFSSNATLTLILLGLSQFFFGISFGLTTALYANCAIYAHYTTGKDTTGFITSLLSLSIKLSIFLRGLIITAVLTFIGYNVEMTLTNHVISNMNTMFFVVPAALIGISVIPILFYTIKDNDIVAMKSEIDRRKTNDVIA